MKFKIYVSLLTLFVTLNPILSAAKATGPFNSKIESKTLSMSVGKKPQPHVLELAVKAHKKANAMGLSKKPLVTIIDYSMPSSEKRLWVMNMDSGKVMYHTHVAHGSGSGMKTAERFSDKPGSLQTSLGVFVTGKTYQGKHGLSLTLHGMEKGVNGNAERRRIVIHSAHYVSSNNIKSSGRIGRSWGCPALSLQEAKPIIGTIKEGSLLFAYYPDKKWLNKSQFLM